MITKFAMAFPETNETEPYLQVNVYADDAAFRMATNIMGACEHSETCGMSFNMQDTRTGDKKTWIALNASRLTIETIHHEVRHAIFYYLSDEKGIFAFDTLSAGAEEGINRAIDLSVKRAVHTISEALGIVIPYFAVDEMPEAELTALMEELAT